MSIRSTLFTTAFLIATLGTAHAESLRPIQAKSVDLGDVSGVAYYTIERDGFHVVTTLPRATRERQSALCQFLHLASTWYCRPQAGRAGLK